MRDSLQPTFAGSFLPPWPVEFLGLIDESFPERLATPLIVSHAHTVQPTGTLLALGCHLFPALQGVLLTGLYGEQPAIR